MSLQNGVFIFIYLVNKFATADRAIYNAQPFLVIFWISFVLDFITHAIFEGREFFVGATLMNTTYLVHIG